MEVVDAKGVVRTDCSGLMRVALYGSPDDLVQSDEQQVQVTSGAWEVTAPASYRHLRVHGLRLEMRTALCADLVDITNRESPITLRARWLESMLRVVADDSGADLTDLRVVRQSDFLWDCPHPGNDIVTVLDRVSSPLRIPSSDHEAEVSYWIRGPVHAWDQIKLVTNDPNERVLRLLPGGDVDVSIVGDVPEGAMLRCYGPMPADAAERPFAELLPAARGATRIDALPAGEWLVVLAMGMWFRHPVLLGQTRTTVVHGTINTATLTVNPNTLRPPMVKVRGTLALSPRWGDQIRLDLEPTGNARLWQSESRDIALAAKSKIDLEAMTKDRDGHYQWGEIDLIAGHYEITLRGCGYRTIVDIGPNSPVDVNVVVPEPQQVRVRLLDAQTGQPVASDPPYWHPMIEGWSSGIQHVVTQEVGDGWYTFLAPMGPIMIHSHPGSTYLRPAGLRTYNDDPEDYSRSQGRYEVGAGTNEFLLQIRKGCGVEIVLREGDAKMPWPVGARADIKNTSSGTGIAYDNNGKLAAREPGEHTLTISPIDGYEPIVPRQVLVEPAKWTRVEITLRRIR